MSFYLVNSDITNRHVDAIVCPTNASLRLAGPIGKKVLEVAGKDIINEINSFKSIKLCGVVVTKGYNLPAKYVIHAYGPTYIDGDHNEVDLLIKTYKSIFRIAKKYNFDSIEIPLLCSGRNGFPKEIAAKVAIECISRFTSTNEISVGLILYTENDYLLCQHIKLDRPCHLELNKPKKKQKTLLSFSNERKLNIDTGREPLLKFIATSSEYVLDDDFHTKLFKYLNKCGKPSVDIYKKVGMDRKLFSKILSHNDYIPKKPTVISLIVGMDLDIADASDLLDSAGYTFSKSILFDNVMKKLIESGEHDINIINDELMKNNLPLMM